MVTTCHIRPIDTPEEMALVVAIQRAVWPGSDLEIAPVHVMLTAAHNGGLVAGAFVGGRLAGFVFGFLGFYESGQGRRLKHCSHMLGVHPDFRCAGIGAALKSYQREYALSQGLDLITWTYDPLLARNAQLNIAKLGATCNTYLVNLYGDLNDGLNTGLPTDRFQVHWFIRTQQVAERVQQTSARRPSLADYLATGAVHVNPLALPRGLEPPEFFPDDAPGRPDVLLGIPANFLTLKMADPALALRWRMGTRVAFQALFRQGYTVCDFVYQSGPTPSAAYVLSPVETTQEPS